MARITQPRSHPSLLRHLLTCGVADLGIVAAALFCSLYLLLVVIVSVLHAAHML